MEPEGSLPRLQVSTTCPYPEPNQSSPPPPPHPTAWRFNLILCTHLRLGLPGGFFTWGFPTQNLLDFITRIIFGEEYRSLSPSLCSFFHSLVTSSLLGPNILLNILYSNTLCLRSSLNVSDYVSHPYKTTGKIVDLYIQIFIRKL